MSDMKWIAAINTPRCWNARVGKTIRYRVLVTESGVLALCRTKHKSMRFDLLKGESDRAKSTFSTVQNAQAACVLHHMTTTESET